MPNRDICMLTLSLMHYFLEFIQLHTWNILKIMILEKLCLGFESEILTFRGSKILDELEFVGITMLA